MPQVVRQDPFRIFHNLMDSSRKMHLQVSDGRMSEMEMQEHLVSETAYFYRVTEAETERIRGRPELKRSPSSSSPRQASKKPNMGQVEHKVHGPCSCASCIMQLMCPGGSRIEAPADAMLEDETVGVVLQMTAAEAAAKNRAEEHLSAACMHETHAEALGGAFGDDEPRCADPIGDSVLHHSRQAEQHQLECDAARSDASVIGSGAHLYLLPLRTLRHKKTQWRPGAPEII